MTTKSTLTDAQKQERISSHKKRVVGAKRLATVASTNPKTPTQTYDIMLGSDNLVYCTCPAWVYTVDTPQSCKHITQFRSTLP